jgi:hypothetical protein
MALEMKYFVLSPESSDPAHAAASIHAMYEYANVIAVTDPQRAYDIRIWANDALAKLPVVTS